jgi:hypothetical protein
VKAGPPIPAEGTENPSVFKKAEKVSWGLDILINRNILILEYSEGGMDGEKRKSVDRVGKSGKGG